MNILVTGGTGTVGSQVVRGLSGTPHKVKVLTRDPAKAATLPRVEAVAGNLREPATVRRVFDGIDAVFLVNTVSQTEATEGLMAVSGMREAGVKRVVYVSVQDADKAAWLPHFGSKVGVEEALRRSGMSCTILRPNNFYQNDYLFKDAILQYGIYPQPIGDVGLGRVDVRDIADAAIAALTSSGHEGQTYDLTGPDNHTGASTARVWSDALKRSVAYGGDDLEAWEKQSLQYMPDWAVYDFKLMYAFFQKDGLRASSEGLARQARLLGHPPRSFEAFAQETASAWGGAV
jgi:uncharacterized protein YbjT (DUF2867 family)